jgi:hypothetical protein
MSVMTASAVLAMITTQHCVPPSLTLIVLAYAQHESGLDPNAIHRNSNGTVDYGVAQINSGNLGWLGLTPQTVMEPCANILAAAKVFIVRYNGNDADQQKAAYADDVIAKIWAVTEATQAAPVPALGVAT